MVLEVYRLRIDSKKKDAAPVLGYKSRSEEGYSGCAATGEVTGAGLRGGAWNEGLVALWGVRKDASLLRVRK